MKKLVIREQAGRYHLENFGPEFSGEQGKEFFTLVIESKGRGLYLEFPHATLHDLFTRFNLKSPEFLRGEFICPDFVRVTEENDECVVEAGSGTLYDFFRERAAARNCLLRAARPVSFYWRGTADRVA
ncbi:MAG: hypothetical protein ACXVB9_14325 [Bdellovibrionota bacterium]